MKILSELLARFPEVTEDRGEYVVPCPVHNDNRPSLCFRLKDDGRLLVRCWAGCDVREIRKALSPHLDSLSGWTAGEGVRTSAKAVAGSLEPGDLAALAMYVDATNAALLSDSPHAETAREYVARRFGLATDRAADLGLGVDYAGVDQRFPFRSTPYQMFERLTVPLNDFSGNPRGLQGRDLSGYCPARWLSLTSPAGRAWGKYGVFRANSGFDTVLITEGPGDALTGVAVGYDTVAVRGAGLARNEALISELAEGLGDRDVVLAGDRDNAGEAFTDALADALVRAGVMVRKLEIPNEGDDLTDWRGRDVEAFPSELHAAVRRAPLHRVDAPEHVPDPPKEEIMMPFPLTDLGNAERLFRQLGGNVRMVPGAGVYKWTGRHWTQVPQEALYADVREVVKSIRLEDHADITKRDKWAERSQDSQKVKGMVEMLSSIPGVYATVDAFDACPYRMSFRNCVVDLRNGKVKDHDPDDMNTSYIDVDYRADAQAPRWERFLTECHPNSADMPGFLQLLTGYGITGYGAERIFVMHVGPTTNGKTTFTASLEETFKSTTKRADASLFQRRRESGGPRADVVGLRGKRLVISSEWPANMPLDQALMKAVTGDQTITARGVYAKTELTFKPVCLVQVDTNYAPDVDATDAALWQRMRVVPWLEDFRGREDRHLQATLKREREGIAAWAVRGAIEWFRLYESGKGLEFPQEVERFTAHYRDSSHPLAGFIGEEFESEEGAFVAKAETWTRYQTWAEECGIKHTMTRNKFYDAVRTLPGVMEGQSPRGQRGFRNLRDVKATGPSPHKGGAQDIFGQAKS